MRRSNPSSTASRLAPPLAAAPHVFSSARSPPPPPPQDLWSVRLEGLHSLTPHLPQPALASHALPSSPPSSSPTPPASSPRTLSLPASRARSPHRRPGPQLRPPPRPAPTSPHRRRLAPSPQPPPPPRRHDDFTHIVAQCVAPPRCPLADSLPPRPRRPSRARANACLDFVQAKEKEEKRLKIQQKEATRFQAQAGSDG